MFITEELPITYDEVLIKLSHVVTDISIEMLEASRDERLKLHHLGIEVDAISFKLKCYRQLGMFSSEPLAAISDELDDVFTRLLYEGVERLMVNAA